MNARTATGIGKAFKESWYQKTAFQKTLFLVIAIVPGYVGYLLFTLYPNVLGVYYSTLNWSGFNEPVFVGIDNFIKLFQDEFVWRALSHNLILMLTIPILVIVISLIVAYLLTNHPFAEYKFYKVLFFFPNVLSIVVIALLWAFIYDGSFGLLNGILRMIGLDAGELYWLGEERLALWALIPPSIWSGVGLYIVIFMNAMNGVPKSLYEAAILEGASHYVRLFNITLPLIMGVVRVGVLFMILGVFKGFELILILTNGGPSGSTDVIGLYMFNLAFGKGYHNYGYASAIGMFLFVILVVAKLLLDKFMPEQKTEF